MEYMYCNNCRNYYYGTITTGGFYCSNCGRTHIYYYHGIVTTGGINV